MLTGEKINSAQTSLQQGDTNTAEQIYLEILQSDPENVCALDGLGVVRCQQTETEQGIELFQKALEFLRKNPKPNPHGESTLLFHAGLAYRTLGLHTEALKYLTEAECMTPNEPDLLINIGQLYFDLEQYDEAAARFRTLTVIQPDNASGWLTLGFILSNQNRNDEAAEVLKAAELLDTGSPEICFYLAESLRKSERYGESISRYQRLLPVGTQYPQAIHAYGKALLALGQLADGWDAMEFRFASSVGNWERHHLPNWSQETNQHVSRVLAYSEEGTGAELMFASCLPDLINTVDHCVVECEPSLHNLFRRSFPRATFVPLADDYVRIGSNPWNIELESQIAFGSLPRYFRREIGDFPLRKTYLVPDKDRVAKWSNRFAEIGDAKKIGILWQGTWTDETVQQTALPIPELSGLFIRHQEAAWICLQHGSHQNDLNDQRRFGVQPRIFSEAFKYDLDAMAALITALDLVITPPGYVAHLAGALGVQTWLLVPEGADWRHTIDMVSQPRCVWHPSVKMYRQAKGESWRNFFTKVEDDLDSFLTTHRPPEEALTPMPMTLVFPKQQTIPAAGEAA